MPPHRSYLIGAHAVRGATKEKSRKLDELKARRKAKDVKKKVRLLRLSERLCVSLFLSLLSVSVIAREARPLLFSYGHGNLR